MNPLTQFKQIPSTTSHYTGALRIGVARVGYVAARKYRSAVEQDRRGHSRGLGRVPSRGVHLHGLHLGCRL